MTFKCGDVVRLKSGGPDMTVGSVLTKGALSATWFDGTRNVRALFHVDMLVKVA